MSVLSDNGYTIHRATVKIPLDEFERVNRLLKIESLEDLTDEQLCELGATEDECYGVYSAKFDDGSTINFDLCSGQHNYFDDVVWTNADGSHDVVLDCSYELDSLSFEVDYDIYVVFVKTTEC